MALAVVRILSITNRSIQILFTDNLDPNITSANISIISSKDNVPDATVFSVEVEDDILTVNFSPIFPNIQYKILFESTDVQNFQTANGERIFENGSRNVLFITSPGEVQNDIRDNMLRALPVVYESEEPSRLRNIISSVADQLQRTQDAMSTVRSANYISVMIEDESVIRDDGPTDKLANGGVFEVLRVGSTPTASPISGSIVFSEDRLSEFEVDNETIINPILGLLTDDPISAQAVQIINEIVSDDINADNFFDGLKMKVINKPVIQLISVTLEKDGVLIPYDISTFGYALKDNKYDTQLGSINVNLADNEIELSTASITGLPGGFEEPAAGDTIKISYIYKRLGRNVDPETVELSTVLQSIREIIPSTLTVFALENAPIVLFDDSIPRINGVSFLNAQAVDGNPPFTVNHPAFRVEIPFSATRTPSRPGEFAVNYSTGQVFVFGEDLNNFGTGDTPPVATYFYRKIFTPIIDYTFNSDRDELAVKSTRNISGVEATIRFDFEDTFAEGEDFRLLSHIEVLNERIENRLIADFEIETINFPVTDAFRIFNETTGEIYNIQRITDTSIIFSGRRAPEQIDINRERIRFVRVPQEVLLIGDELTNDSGFRVLKINLSNSGITDSQRRFIGANFDTSVIFSEDDIFVSEKFYEDRLFSSIDANINRLTAISEYIIDYNNGIVYVAVSQDQDSDIGDISYEYKDIQTNNDHILRVNNIYRSASSLEANITDYIPGDITDTTVNILGLEQTGERFIDNDSTRPLLVGTHQNGDDGITIKNSNIFTSNSAVFTADDVGRTLLVGSTNSPPIQEVTITGIISEKQVLVTPAFANTASPRVWSVLDLSFGAPKTIALAHEIISVQNIYSVNQLGSRVFSDLDGYFDINRDSFDGNIITLGDDNPLSVGDAIIVVYNYGEIFVDYRYLNDDLLVSYEYGNNSLDWSISSALSPEEEYFVTYKFGALRQPLLTNFGSLTQIPLLTNFPTDLDREVYRSVVQGTLQSFIEGPTIPSIKRLVQAFTDVEPEIRESVFDQWIVGIANLHLRDIESDSDPSFDIGKFGNGLAMTRNTDNIVQIPALANFRLEEGTWESWVVPEWNGLSNDAEITFDLTHDGYQDVSKVYIGFDGINPDTVPFSLNTIDTDISVFGEPKNIDEDVGYFIWFDEFANRWNIRWRERREDTAEFGDVGHVFSGTITTSGEFFTVSVPTGSDGYTLNEVGDTITSKTTTIQFSATIDCHDGFTIGSVDGGLFTDTDFLCTIDGGTFTNMTFVGSVDGGLFTDTEFTEEIEFSSDGITFGSGALHYIFDMAHRPNANRISLYKDGTGYLNFEVFDNQAIRTDNVGLYNISSDVQAWQAGEPHHVAISWKFNSYNERDEMHLFIDGAEVPNLFKYGGNPAANSSFKFGEVAEETIISSATRPIIGAFDGSSEAGSNLFRSSEIDFFEAGVLVGDILYILEDNQDGLQSFSEGQYTITGVGSHAITISSALTLTLGDIHFSINQATLTVSSPTNFQDFIIIVRNSSGDTELPGLAATEPYYSTTQGSSGTHIISINNGVNVGDLVIIKTLGLIFRRCQERIFVYSDGDNIIRFAGPVPIDIQDIDITAILLPRFLIDPDDGGVGIVSTLIGGVFVNTAQTVFDDTEICQPSNSVNGRKLDIMLSGDNINYSIAGNEITINGTAFSGATSETISFTENDIQTTTEYWMTIDSVNVSVVPVDATQPIGVLEIKENKPINESDNNGDYAEIVSWDNGIIELDIFGTAGTPFNVQSCTYEIDYPTFLRIKIDAQPDTIFLGTDFRGQNRFNGSIDEVRSLKFISEDTRVGEDLEFGARSITTDFNATDKFDADNDTLLLTHFEEDIEDSAKFIDSFDNGFISAASVNSNFGSSMLVADNNPFIINNAGGTFNNNSGTIEFWVSPLDDTNGDPNNHYYIDLSSSVIEEQTSNTKLNVIISQRAREIVSVRLLTDINENGTNFFTGGSLSNIDNKTITLGIPLVSQNVPVKITYVPLDFQGDRVSIFRDDQGFVNFFMKASGIEHLISTHVDWKRHTWHRIMAMWRTNSADNNDRLRLFVDGTETGTIKYGTGLIYGTGIIYGQAEVRPDVNRFVVDNIDLFDTFSKIYIGTDILQVNGARARLDNIRFSESERLSSIKTIGGVPTDLNYIANTEFALPSIEDVFTTRLINFNNEIKEVEFLANLINAERGIFRFEIDVIDSFDKVIGDERLENLLEDLINTLKPAHTEAIIRFIE